MSAHLIITAFALGMLIGFLLVQICLDVRRSHEACYAERLTRIGGYELTIAYTKRAAWREIRVGAAIVAIILALTFLAGMLRGLA